MINALAVFRHHSVSVDPFTTVARRFSVVANAEPAVGALRCNPCSRRATPWSFSCSSWFPALERDVAVVCVGAEEQQRLRRRSAQMRGALRARLAQMRADDFESLSHHEPEL
jgi:hypothetical protein